MLAWVAFRRAQSCERPERSLLPPPHSQLGKRGTERGLCKPPNMQLHLTIDPTIQSQEE